MEEQSWDADKAQSLLSLSVPEVQACQKQMSDNETCEVFSLLSQGQKVQFLGKGTPEWRNNAWNRLSLEIKTDMLNFAQLPPRQRSYALTQMSMKDKAHMLENLTPADGMGMLLAMGQMQDNDAATHRASVLRLMNQSTRLELFSVFQNNTSGADDDIGLIHGGMSEKDSSQLLLAMDPEERREVLAALKRPNPNLAP